ncbi:MAG TPA: hypothetical protein VLE99_03700 [Candidatus Saccharimonadales bacterium]|nr:hypothetical protein [Candidatus Saccharimonadales bacterium]
MNNEKLSLGSLKGQLASAGHKLARYRAFGFFLMVAILYTFIVWRVNAASNVPLNASEQTAKTVAQPHIDPATVAKIQSLQDNSVSVQSLFDNARQNPFQE